MKRQPDPKLTYEELKEYYHELLDESINLRGHKTRKNILAGFKAQTERKKLKHYKVQLNKILVYWADDLNGDGLEQLYLDKCVEMEIKPTTLSDRKFT